MIFFPGPITGRLNICIALLYVIYPWMLISIKVTYKDVSITYNSDNLLFWQAETPGFRKVMPLSRTLNDYIYYENHIAEWWISCHLPFSLPPWLHLKLDVQPKAREFVVLPSCSNPRKIPGYQCILVGTRSCPLLKYIDTPSRVSGHHPMWCTWYPLAGVDEKKWRKLNSLN
jgi:hypothetical protein